TGKINQGNIALKRVVESIANGDSHVPFRDSKLTMLLQDSFEDNKSKILMILCASPDPKEMHKTISTLEYGAKAKCIIRGPPTPTDKLGDDSASSVILGSRIAAMDQLILKLQIENKRREKERNEAHKLLLLKEEEIAQLRVKLQKMEVSGASEEEINLKVRERTKRLKQELEKQLEDCQRMAKEYVELEKKRMEETIQHQQHEVEILRKRLQEMEMQLSRSRDGRGDPGASDLDGTCLARRLMEAYRDERMEKSMDLDMREESCGKEVKIIGGEIQKFKDNNQQAVVTRQNFLTANRIGLSTVVEEEEVEKSEDEEIEKTVIEEKRVTNSPRQSSLGFQPENLKDLVSSRKLRIQNIFSLCGNHRELSQQLRPRDWEQKKSVETDASAGEKSPLPEPVNEVKLVDTNVYRSPTPNKVATESKENMTPMDCDADSLMEVYVKWEATKGTPGKFINKLK
ncbi:Kinesin-like protein, partial [Drosera capensis]